MMLVASVNAIVLMFSVTMVNYPYLNFPLVMAKFQIVLVVKTAQMAVTNVPIGFASVKTSIPTATGINA